MDRRKRTELRRRHPRQQSTKHHRNRDLRLKNMNFGRFCNTLIISHRNKIAHFAPHFFSDPNKIEHKKFGSSDRVSLYLRHKNRRTMKQLLLFLLGCMAPLAGMAQCVVPDTLNLVPVSPGDIDEKYPSGNLPVHRIPGKGCTLPVCAYGNGQISLTASTEFGNFSYCIVNEESETVLAGEGYLSPHAPFYIDVTELYSGYYTFVLFHSGYYGATFCKQ